MSEKKYKLGDDVDVVFHLPAGRVREMAAAFVRPCAIELACPEAFEEEAGKPAEVRGKFYTRNGDTYIVAQTDVDQHRLIDIDNGQCWSYAEFCPDDLGTPFVELLDHRVAVVGPDDVLLTGEAAKALRRVLDDYVLCRNYSPPRPTFQFERHGVIDIELQTLVNALSKDKDGE